MSVNFRHAAPMIVSPFHHPIQKAARISNRVRAYGMLLSLNRVAANETDNEYRWRSLPSDYGHTRVIAFIGFTRLWMLIYHLARQCLRYMFCLVGIADSLS